MTFAESSKAYTERDFQVKACVSVAGPTQVGKVGVSACSNESQSEISKASKMSKSEKRFVKGGKRETNSNLANGATSVELFGHGNSRIKSIPKADWGISKRVSQIVLKMSGKFVQSGFGK